MTYANFKAGAQTFDTTLSTLEAAGINVLAGLNVADGSGSARQLGVHVPSVNEALYPDLDTHSSALEYLQGVEFFAGVFLL